MGFRGILRELVKPLMNEGGFLAALGIASAFGLGQGLINRATSSPSRSSTKPVPIPGLFNREEGREFAFGAGDLIGQRSPFRARFEEELLNPSFAPTTESEIALLSQVQEGLQGRFNRLGIGASPNLGDIAAGTAPTLVALRQARLRNLRGGIQEDRAGRELDIRTGLQLAGFGVPRFFGQTEQRGPTPGLLQGTGFNFNIPVPSAAPSLYGFQPQKPGV